MGKNKTPDVPVKSSTVKIDDNTEYTFGLSTIDKIVCIDGEKYFIEKELPFSVLKKKIGKCDKCKCKNSSSLCVLIIFLFMLNSKSKRKKECDKCNNKEQDIEIEINEDICEKDKHRRKHHKSCH